MPQFAYKGKQDAQCTTDPSIYSSITNRHATIPSSMDTLMFFFFIKDPYEADIWSGVWNIPTNIAADSVGA